MYQNPKRVSPLRQKYYKTSKPFPCISSIYLQLGFFKRRADVFDYLRPRNPQISNPHLEISRDRSSNFRFDFGHLLCGFFFSSLPPFPDYDFARSNDKLPGFQGILSSRFLVLFDDSMRNCFVIIFCSYVTSLHWKKWIGDDFLLMFSERAKGQLQFVSRTNIYVDRMIICSCLV